MRRIITILLAFAVAFTCGYSAGGLRKPAVGSFHDIIVNHPRDLTGLVTPKDRRVRALAAELMTPENAFAYVRDHIGNDPAIPAMSAGEILTQGRASCLGKAALLCSLYRAMGIPAAEVRVVTGEVVGPPDSVIEHAWVDMEYKGRCIQQDATNLLGTFGFDQFQGTAYTRAFIRREGYVFNDKQFAIVSQLNQMKGTGHPPLQ
jgi:hypothetical protein